MSFNRGAAILALLAGLITGCTQEAGAPLGRGPGGLTGEARAARIADLGTAFNAAVDPVVNFDFASAALDAAARARIARQAAWLLANPEAAVRVTGHTDLVGSDAANLDLGRRRAAAVVSQLIAQGVGQQRVAGVVSRGESQPIVPTQGRSRVNRRTITEVAWLGRVPQGVGFGVGGGMDGVRARNVYDAYQARENTPPQPDQGFGQ